MGKRYKIGKYYVVRRKDGTIERWVSIKSSLAQDRKIKAKTRVKKGYGHRGDFTNRGL